MIHPFQNDIIPPSLRGYQQELIAAARVACAKQSAPIRLIVQGETGSGKGVLGAALMCNAYAMGKKALFIARGRQLVKQFAEHLRKCNLPSGIIMAGHGITDAPLQVASKDTLASRYLRNEWLGLPDFDLAVWDEAHDQGAEWMALMQRFRIVVGLTATPAKASGDGLGAPWKDMVCCRPPSWLIANKFIVPTKVFAPFVPDLNGVKANSGGDYIADSLAKKIDRPSLVGDIVVNWFKYGEGRPTLVFACTIEHAKHIRDRFIQAGVKAMHIDQETPDDQRDAIFAATTAGTNTIITNVAVMNRGVDLPCVSCIVLARPTRSFILYRQALGRGKRPFLGKVDLRVIDHAGSVFVHGMPDDDVDWTLSDEENVQENRAKERDEGKAPEPICCPKCFAMFTPRPACPNCGAVCVQPRKTKEVVVGDGLLVPVNGVPASATLEEKQRFWTKCLFVTGMKDQNFYAARGMYKSKYKEDLHPGFKPQPEPGDWGKKVAVVYPWTVTRRKAAV